MPDLLALLKAMAVALRQPAPLDWASVAPLIGIHFDGVRPISRSGAASAIEGGGLVENDLPVDGVIVLPPRPEISLRFPGKALSEPDISGRQFAADQRIVDSRSGRGYAIVFPIGGVSCAILVTEPGAFIDGVTVSDPRPTQTALKGSADVPSDRTPASAE